MSDSGVTKQETAINITVEPLEMVIDQIYAERARQCNKGYDDAHDDCDMSVDEFAQVIDTYLKWAHQMHRMDSPDKYRRRMMQVATLAIAACESFDRKASGIAGGC